GVAPLLAVFRQDRDDLAALEAECEQAEADQPGMLVEIGPGVGQPDAELLLAVGDLCAVLLAVLAEQLGQRIAAVEVERAGSIELGIEAVPVERLHGGQFFGDRHGCLLWMEQWATITSSSPRLLLLPALLAALGLFLHAQIEFLHVLRFEQAPGLVGH